MSKRYFYVLSMAGIVAVLSALVFGLTRLPRDTEEVVFRDPRDRTQFRMDMLNRRIIDQSKAAFPISIEQATLGLAPEGRRALARDAWNRPLRFTVERNSYEIRSAGPDGRWYTPDDLVVRGVKPLGR